MMIASSKRGLAAGMMSAALALATGPAAQAQAQRSNAQQPARANPAKAAPAAKPTPAATAKPAPATAAKPVQPQAQAATGPGGSSLVATFGDWGVYTAQAGRSKICYALSQPKDRLPKNLSRDPAYLFVSFRPAENVRNEVALVLGFAARENGPAEAAIGTASYALLTKASNAWLKNPAEEGQAIGTMSKASSVTVKAQSARGNQLTDRYSLNGFGQALERARRECGA
jgi:glucose/arabinose dehydrogenase